MIHITAKVSEGTNRNMPARNTLVQLLALYTDHESHNALHYRQMDDMIMPKKTYPFSVKKIYI